MIELNDKQRKNSDMINYFYGTVTRCDDKFIVYQPDDANPPVAGNDKERVMFRSSYKDEDVIPYVGQYIIILVNYKGRDFTRRNFVIYDAANYETKMGLTEQRPAKIHK